MLSRRRITLYLLSATLVLLLLRRYLATASVDSTGLTLDTFASRHARMAHSESCPFCRLADAYGPADSHVPPQGFDHEATAPSCHLVLSTPHVLAFLDIMPITRGHVLVVPRQHREKLGDLSPGQGAALGAWLPVVSRAVMKALGREGGDWNVVQNNGASAAQVVPHVHYHIIPRGGQGFPEAKARSWTIFGRGQREELDDDEGAQLAAAIRKEVAEDLKGMAAGRDAEGFRMLSKL